MAGGGAAVPADGACWAGFGTGFGAGRGSTGPLITSKSKLLRCISGSCRVVPKGPSGQRISRNSKCQKRESRLGMGGFGTFSKIARS